MLFSKQSIQCFGKTLGMIQGCRGGHNRRSHQADAQDETRFCRRL